MAFRHWVVSVFITWHVLAIGLGSLGSPDRVPPVESSRSNARGPLAAALAPGLDVLAAGVEPVYRGITENVGPVRHLPETYLRVLGLGQNWKMFVEPVEVGRYLRARYFVGPRDPGPGGAEAVWTATELLLPAHREDQIRTFQSYWDHFRDKAMTSSLRRFGRALPERPLAGDVRSQDLPDDLAPIARFFSRRFEQQALRPDERVVRTEIWQGSAPMVVGPGADPGASDRLDVLREYYQGPIEDHYGRPVYASYGSGEREADIVWVMWYFEP